MFVDEIDAVGRSRGTGIGGGNDEREQTLNQLLTEMDGFEGNTGIIVIAATNRADILDPALLRPGRFDRTVSLHCPAAESVDSVRCIDLTFFWPNMSSTPECHPSCLSTLVHMSGMLTAKVGLAVGQVTVDVPDVRGRFDILKVHARNKKLASEVDLDEIALRTPGFSGADLANLLNEAAILAGRRGLEQINSTEIDDSVDRIVAGG